MKAFRHPAFWFVFALLFTMMLAVSCSSGEDDDDDNDSAGDDDDDDAPDDLPAYFTERPELTDWSLWYSSYDAAAPVADRTLGGLGIGNGRVFAMIGAGRPFSTLHNIAGPHYQKRLRFFSDKTFTLHQHGVEIAWDRETIYRVRGTAVYVTHQQAGNLSLWFIDQAPRGQVMADLLADRTLVRMIVVQNQGDELLTGLSLVAQSKLGKAEGRLLREFILTDGRELAAGFVYPEAMADNEEKSLTVQLDDLAPGGESLARFQMAFAQNADPVPVFETVAAISEDVLLDATLASWKEFTEEGARIVTDDPKFDDLLEGLAITMKTQQATGGCFAQMSEYGYNALRDLYGISRFYPLIGRTADYREMLDYVWKVFRKNGNIAADVEIDHEFENTPPKPDWENLPILTGRAAAESPSYLILHYKAYYDATGDLTPITERYEMLRHALVHQDMREGCLLPFSDDETYRVMMMIAFGHDIFEGYQDKFLSANSSFLFVMAAKFMEQVADMTGLADHAQEYAELAFLVRECTEEYYWLEGGFYSPILDINTLLPVTQPFEDVNTKPVWLGYLAPDDPKAESNLEVMEERLARKGGLLYSPVHPGYHSLAGMLGFSQGVVTGMAAGYQLDVFSRQDHPLAADAFASLPQFFHDTGNVSEVMVVDDFGRMAYLQEPYGLLCDLTARYRSWEGAINAAAAIQYLFGLELDAGNGRIAIAPHLPDEWSNARMEDARLGEDRFSISVEDDGQARTVTVYECTGPLVVDAVIPLEDVVKSVLVNGETVEPEITNRWGRWQVLLPGLSAGSDKPLVIEVMR